MCLPSVSETAIVRILNDMIGVMDKGRVLLDLSAAFDTVDHSILTTVTKKRFGVDGSALGWVTDFLSDRSQTVRTGKANYYGDAMLQFGVPQGSVLDPRIFIQYAEDVAELFSQHGLHHHVFADDMQGHCSGRPVD